ncbi:sensor histidine kinase [Clostridium akagii]|uniref:sensor histidine kinase n=1 Tax=Clostridium akagii TaxID=91623 RepID=UPI00047EC0DA|nr:sensor histidine kinase [Clostridium akagii]
MNYINLTKYIFLILPALYNLYKIPMNQYGNFIFIFLIIFLNSQLRSLNINNNVKLISFILEPLLVLYISNLYFGFSFIIIFSTIIDASLKLKRKIYPYLLLTGIILIYLVKISCSTEWVVIITIFYIAIFLLLLELRKALVISKDTQVLYDQIRKYSYELEGAKTRLIDYSKQVEKVSQLEERTRISRELHDSIGHSLTGVLMQVDACIQIMNVNKEKGIELLNSVYKNINKSIETVKETVHKLYPIGYKTNLESLRDLINKFKLETGTTMEFVIDGNAFEIPPAVETVIYSNVQEAITNSVRYSYSNNISIKLLYNPQYIEIFISDDGVGAKDLKKGFGITGIEERITLIGGTVSFSGNNGFHIHMVIPIMS